jgi:hypothetical protein
MKNPNVTSRVTRKAARAANIAPADCRVHPPGFAATRPSGRGARGSVTRHLYRSRCDSSMAAGPSPHAAGLRHRRTITNRTPCDYAEALGTDRSLDHGRHHFSSPDSGPRFAKRRFFLFRSMLTAPQMRTTHAAIIKNIFVGVARLLSVAAWNIPATITIAPRVRRAAFTLGFSAISLTSLSSSVYYAFGGWARAEDRAHPLQASPLNRLVLGTGAEFGPHIDWWLII